MTTAPSGRLAKPAPKVASDSISLMKGVCPGKKAPPIWTAKKA